LQVTGDLTKDSEAKTPENHVQAQKKLVETLKAEWKQLWSERLNDKVRAEDISGSNYEGLRVERGTIIHASRDFKPLSFKEVLEQHSVDNPESFVPPNTVEGGWTKFAKTEIHPPKKHRTPPVSSAMEDSKRKTVLQPKKGGRGWLHQK
jgi:hypothetical protein